MEFFLHFFPSFHSLSHSWLQGYADSWLQGYADRYVRQLCADFRYALLRCIQIFRTKLIRPSKQNVVLRSAAAFKYVHTAVRRTLTLSTVHYVR